MLSLPNGSNGRNLSARLSEGKCAAWGHRVPRTETTGACHAPTEGLRGGNCPTLSNTHAPRDTIPVSNPYSDDALDVDLGLALL